MKSYKNRPEGRWLFLVGLLAIAIGFLAIAVKASAVGGTLLGLGIIIMAFGAVVDRTKRVKLSATGFEADLSDQPHGIEFVQAAASASDEALEAMIPLLQEDLDVGTAVVELPAAYNGTTLREPVLHWIRQELNIQVFAVKRPDDRHWSGGGRITELRLVTGSELAVVGDRADIGVLRQRFEGEAG